MISAITFIIGCMFGLAIMSIFSVNSYEKGYKDGKGRL